MGERLRGALITPQVFLLEHQISLSLQFFRQLARPSLLLLLVQRDFSGDLSLCHFSQFLDQGIVLHFLFRLCAIFRRGDPFGGHFQHMKDCFFIFRCDLALTDLIVGSLFRFVVGALAFVADDAAAKLGSLRLLL